jgi:hypothetical protein
MTTPATPTREGLVYCCLTHIPLWVDFPSYVVPIYMGEAQAPGRLNVRDLAPEWDPYWPVVGSQVGTFAIRNYIAKNFPHAKRVGICQYRKFVSRPRVGVSAENYPVMDVISKTRIGSLPLGEIMSPLGPLLIGRPARFDAGSGTYDYLHQFAGAHFVEDLLRFTAEAVELGVLPGNQVHPFFSENIFFPGGAELGIFPIDFWISAVDAIEKVTRAVREISRPRPRPWGFCIERLGSWMLLQYLRTETWGSDWNLIGGHLNLITQDESKTYVPGA